jgi:hypothetical protein
MIQIQVQGKIQIDDKTIIINPLVIVQQAIDNYIGSIVQISCIFKNVEFQLHRDAGQFIYVTDWTDNDVIDHLNLWILEHTI